MSSLLQAKASTSQETTTGEQLQCAPENSRKSVTSENKLSPSLHVEPLSLGSFHKKANGLPCWYSWLSHRADGHRKSRQEDDQNNPQGSKDTNLSGLHLTAP